jgi:nuclear pore complex protein Nup133
MEPKEVLGAGIDEVDSRFKNLDASIRDGIMRDMQDEDDTLKPLIDKHRLEKWFQGVLDLAKHDYAEGLAAETEDGQNMQSVALELQNLEKAIEEQERGKAESLLKTKLRFKPKVKLNGSTNMRASIRQY